MIEKYNALEWQSFSQKKNIEEIAKNTKDKNDIQITAVIEVWMFVASIVVDNLFSENAPPIVYKIIFLISAGPILWLAGKYIKRLWKKWRKGSDILDTDMMINLFDNDICYYALMAESYSEQLKSIDEKKISDSDRFYFIEACFYITKTIYNLSLTENAVSNLYSSNSSELYRKRKISKTRVQNIICIIDNALANIKEYEFMIKEIDERDNYIELLGMYVKSYNRFKNKIKNV